MDSPDMGRIEIITGPMFSGKSEELIRRLTRARIAGKRVRTFKPIIDIRYGRNEVSSHSGAKIPAEALRSLNILERLVQDRDVIGLDEIQFWPEDEVLNQIPSLASNGKIVICSGLDMTYRQEPFGCMPKLLAIADRVVKLSAICAKCGSEEGIYTQRLHDGEPALFTEDTIVVGGLESYEARCRTCFQPG